MSALTDVLAKHQYRPNDRSCTCDENWYDTRPSRDQDLVEHFLHVESELAAAGFGSVGDARAAALDEAAETIDGDSESSLYNKRRLTASGPYSKPMRAEDSAELEGIESAGQLVRSLAAQARQTR